MKAISLRRTALGWMTALFAVIGLFATLAAYRLARNEAADFLDGQLRQVAINAGPRLVDAQAPPAADQDPEDQLAVTIWRRGSLLRSDLNVDPIQPRQLGYADALMDGELWRTYTTTARHLTVRVAQRDVVRAEFARNAALGAVAPIVLLIPLSWLVIGLVMRRVLDRLDALARDLAGRSAATLAPLPTDGVPAEVAPLVVAMNGLIQRLQGSLDSQSRFIADAAHALRTPLAASMAQLDALAGTTARGDRDALAASLFRARALVDQLLQLARLEGPSEQLADRLDLPALLLESVADYAVLAQAKDIDLGVAIRTTGALHAASIEIYTLVATLLDNAVRYTPAGGKVDVSLHREDDRCMLDVRDTGCGLARGSEERIFDRFFRAAPPGIDGTGLGLAIAKRIADRNGFQLLVENRCDGPTGVLARLILPV